MKQPAITQRRIGAMPKTISTIALTLGGVLVAAALCLTAHNVWEGHNAGLRASFVLDDLISAIENTAYNPSDWNPQKEAPPIVIGGYEYMGILAIPSISRNLPVMSGWSYDLLTISPCRYSGSYVSDDMVICSHNYPEHLGPARDLAIGADVYFTASDGNCIHYTVSNVELIEPFDVGRMVGSTAHDWDLILFTCDLSGQARITVRCLRA